MMQETRRCSSNNQIKRWFAKGHVRQSKTQVYIAKLKHVTTALNANTKQFHRGLHQNNYTQCESRTEHDVWKQLWNKCHRKTAPNTKQRTSGSRALLEGTITVTNIRNKTLEEFTK